MKKILLLALLASCAPEPYGVDCRTSPSCQKNEAKKQHAAQADAAKTCEANKQVWFANRDKLSLQCDPVKHACSGTSGCGLGEECVNDTYCIKGDTWAGFCGACADRASMEAEQKRLDADIAARQQATTAARVVAEAEIKAGTCTDAGRATLEAGVDGVQKDWPHPGTLHKRGTIVATDAGVRIEADATPNTRYTLTAGGFEKVSLEAKDMLDFRSGSWADQVYGWTRVSQVSTGNQISWTVRGTGCVAWILVRD